jgi:tetratricopeptide (TPR) repeat protein
MLSILARTSTVFILASVVGACATAQSTDRIDFEPVKLVSQPNATDGFEVYDADTLFERGIDLMRGGEHLSALGYFQRVVEEFPESRLVLPAWFNQAVCWIRLEEGQRALDAVDAYMEKLPASALEKYRIDGRFKRGAALMLLERYQEAADLFDVMIVEVELPADQVEALVDSGIAHFMLEDRVTAEYRFMKAKRIHKQASRSERLQVKYFIGQASFYLAEIARMEFSEFKLRYPTREELVNAELEGIMGEQLEKKCQLLLRAQYAFTRTIREGHVGWASASGYKVGTMYEELYDDLVTLPEPDDLTDSQKKIFRQLLKDRVLILLEKAVKIWGSTAEMATRTGQDNLWVDKTRASLQRVREYVLAANGERKAEKTPPTEES